MTFFPECQVPAATPILRGARSGCPCPARLGAVGAPPPQARRAGMLTCTPRGRGEGRLRLLARDVRAPEAPGPPLRPSRGQDERQQDQRGHRGSWPRRSHGRAGAAGEQAGVGRRVRSQRTDGGRHLRASERDAGRGRRTMTRGCRREQGESQSADDHGSAQPLGRPSLGSAGVQAPRSRPSLSTAASSPLGSREPATSRSGPRRAARERRTAAETRLRGWKVWVPGA